MGIIDHVVFTVHVYAADIGDTQVEVYADSSLDIHGTAEADTQVRTHRPQPVGNLDVDVTVQVGGDAGGFLLAAVAVLHGGLARLVRGNAGNRGDVAAQVQDEAASEVEGSLAGEEVHEEVQVSGVQLAGNDYVIEVEAVAVDTLVTHGERVDVGVDLAHFGDIFGEDVADGDGVGIAVVNKTELDVGRYRGGNREVEVCEDKSPIKILREAITVANTEIYEKASTEADFAGMGTTCVAATISDDILYVANVGDSRLYLIDKDITQVTKDHSLVAELVRKGSLDETQAKSHPDKNIITRAIGAAPSVEIDFFEVELNTGDVILMCTDGLTNMVDDDEILRIVKTSVDVPDMAENLIKMANHNGGKDNIGVVIIESSEER